MDGVTQGRCFGISSSVSATRSAAEAAVGQGEEGCFPAALWDQHDPG